MYLKYNILKKVNDKMIDLSSYSVIILFICLFILLIIYYIFFIFIQDKDPNKDKKDQKDEDKNKKDISMDILKDTYDILITIQALLHDPIDRTIPFILNQSIDSTITVNKTNIYLIIWNDKTDKPFDINTIRGAAIHEFAHVICPDIDHTEFFESIEYELIMIAQKLGYYDPTIASDPDYPCVQ